MNEPIKVKYQTDFCLKKFDDATKTLVEEITGGDNKPMVVTQYDPQGKVLSRVEHPVTPPALVAAAAAAQVKQS